MTRCQAASSRPAEIMRRFPKTLAALHAAEQQGARPDFDCLNCMEPCCEHDFIDALGGCVCPLCLETMTEQGEAA